MKREFEEYGPVKKVRIVHDTKSGKPRGYAFIEFDKERDMRSMFTHHSSFSLSIVVPLAPLLNFSSHPQHVPTSSHSPLLHFPFLNISFQLHTNSLMERKLMDAGYWWMWREDALSRAGSLVVLVAGLVLLVLEERMSTKSGLEGMILSSYSSFFLPLPPLSLHPLLLLSTCSRHSLIVQYREPPSASEVSRLEGERERDRGDQRMDRSGGIERGDRRMDDRGGERERDRGDRGDRERERDRGDRDGYRERDRGAERDGRGAGGGGDRHKERERDRGDRERGDRKR